MNTSTPALFLDNLTIDGLDTSSDLSQQSDEAERVLDDSPKIFYQDKFVAFIDLLGFRQIVMRSSAHYVEGGQTDYKKVTIEAVHGALASIPHDDYSAYFRPRHLGDEHDVPGLKLGVAGFSDTMVFWCEPTPEAFGLLIYAIFRTVREFTLRGFYCRGGIKYGELLVDDTALEKKSRATPVMFGPAFISAYDLERIHAGEARVILCNISNRKLAEYREKTNSPNLRKFFNEFLFQAKDGPWQLDMFADFRYPRVDDAEALLTQVDMIATKLRAVLDEYTESPAVHKKLQAVATALNLALVDGAKFVPKLSEHEVKPPRGR